MMCRKIVTFADYVRYRMNKLEARGFAFQRSVAYASDSDTDSCIWELAVILDDAEENGKDFIAQIRLLWPSDDDPDVRRSNAALALEKAVMSYRQVCRRHGIEPDEVLG